jgi:hypothetical protein
MRHSAEHLAPSSGVRASRCRQWTAEQAHQVPSGKASATQMIREVRIAFSHATFDDFFAIFRMHQSLPPLSASTAQRSLTPEHSWRLGVPFAPRLAETICQAWYAGQLLLVSAWLDDVPQAILRACGQSPPTSPADASAPRGTRSDLRILASPHVLQS